MAQSGFYAIDGTVGANLNRTHTSAEQQFELGTVVQLNDNRVAIYVKAAEVISTSGGVDLTATFTASASAGGWIALGSFNATDVGWVRSSGPVAVD